MTAMPDAMSDEYEAITRGVRVRVRTVYLEDQSNPDDGTWVWAYKVRIENGGRDAVQLLRRTWRITDGHGRVHLVHGDGVIGEQPLLQPGEAFEYTSGTPLNTPSGFMAGIYHMVVTSSGETFDAVVPSFSLDSPDLRTQLH